MRVRKLALVPEYTPEPIPEPRKAFGRPRKADDDRADYRLTVRLSRGAGATLEAFAEAHGVSVTEAVRDCLIRGKLIPR